jgi:cyanate permease
MSSAVIFQIQSFLIVALMLFGVAKRRNRSLHVKIMATSIIWDILLILQIEVTRSAIMKASKVMTNPLMLKIHLFFAISSVVLYVLMFITGRKMLSGDMSVRPKHKKLGWTTLFFRIMTLVTSFWAASK